MSNSRPHSQANFSAIRNLQTQGQLDKAIQLCQESLSLQDDIALTALLGTLYAQQQNFAQARSCLEKVIASAQEFNHETQTDIAGIYILLAEPKSALPHLEQALTLAPDFSLARIRHGIVLMQLGQFAAAKAEFNQALAQLPADQHLPIQINLARCAVHLNDTETALTHVLQAQTLGGAAKKAWLLVAVDTYIALNRWSDAEQAIQSALEAGIEENDCIKLLALLLAAQNKHDEAEHYLRKALSKKTDDIELLQQLAALAMVRGHYGVALHCLQTAVKIAPRNSALWTELAQLSKRNFDTRLARSAAEKAVELTCESGGLERAAALITMAAVESDDGNSSEAQGYYQQALDLVPDYPPARLGMGHLLLQWGQVDAAVTQFETVASQYPIAGYGALINARHFPDDPQVLAQIEKAAYIPSLQGPVATSLLFDLAAAYQHRKDYDRAFYFAEQANNASRQHLTYSATKHQADCRKLRQIFNQEFFAARTDYGCPSTLPVFVLGMPRSGTTLVEQILGGHPDIFVAGEIGILSSVIQKLKAWERHLGSGNDYPDCVTDMTTEQSSRFAELLLEELRGYAPRARYIVDKLPHNFENIGLIRLLFPNAAIIHVLREPRDVAISNYFTDYQAKFSGMGFAYDLSDIAHQLVDYQRLMSHWHQVVTKPILTVRYEEVVADTETQARRILAYLNLAWIDKVLNYQNLERAVKTASVWQVRQPIYKTSTEKWRRYEKFLTPLELILNNPAAEEFDNTEQPALPAGIFFQGMDYLHANQSAQAEAVFKQILQHHPHHAAATHMLGVALFQQGQLESALGLIKESISRHPKHPTWYQNLAAVLSALGRHQEAQQAYLSGKNQKVLAVESTDLFKP